MAEALMGRASENVGLLAFQQRKALIRASLYHLVVPLRVKEGKTCESSKRGPEMEAAPTATSRHTRPPLPLLPSGPGGVCGLALREDRQGHHSKASSTTRKCRLPENVTGQGLKNQPLAQDAGTIPRSCPGHKGKPSRLCLNSHAALEM